jgi:hypothetical protein
MPAVTRTKYSVSASMWRRNSRGSKDIRCFGEDMWSNKRRQRFRSDEFDPPAKRRLQQVSKRQKMVVGLFARPELDKNIDVAIRPRCFPLHGSKQGQTLDPKVLHLTPNASKAIHDINAGQGGEDHTCNL